MGSSLLVDGFNYSLLWQATLYEAMPLLLGETSQLQSALNTVWLVVQVALGLGFVIFVHELGHFLAAKTFGVRCDKFYVGFDVPISIGPIKFPRTLGKFQWGETEYGIGIIPLGGYVKMLGQDDDPRQAEEEAKRIRQGEEADAPLDPRSYPAKPVWQRMIIISAGVVMNLIFAVLMAGVAYWYGVPYTPTVAGGTLGGGPAWIAGIQPGDQIVRFGEMDEEQPHMRYDDFAISVIMRGFDRQDQELAIALRRDDERLELITKPTGSFSPEGDIYRIGMAPPTTPIIGDPPYRSIAYLAQHKPDLLPGDVVTAVDEEPLPVDPQFDKVLGSELTARLQAKFDQPITIRLERKSASSEKMEQLEVELPAVPVKTLGIGFAIGPITAVQNDSPAQAAGVRPGDVIRAINGEPVEDALQLPARVARLAAQTIRLTLDRPAPANAAGSETIELEMQGPDAATFDPIAEFAGQLTLAGLGIAFGVKPEITDIEEEQVGDANVQVGDELLKVQWIVREADKQQLNKYFTAKAYEPLLIDQQFTVANLYDILQGMPEDARVKVHLRRNGKVVDASLSARSADDWYWHQRGIGLSPLTELHKTTSIASALQLGLWETARRFTDVLDFLRLLVTGKIGAKGVGGPIAIATAAGSEASHGVSRLLLFLTLLSANLAILNFLPIPALDGGHMMFLTAEAVRGKPVSEALQMRLTMAGVLGLLCLMAFVIIKDILRLVS